MNDTKFIKLLKTLDRKEMIDFCNFVEGKAARQPKDRLAYVDYLKRQHPNFPKQKMTKEYIGQKLFSKAADKIKKVEGLEAKLVPILEDFLIQVELEKHKTKRDFLLLDVYKRRKLDDLFFKKIKQIEKGWEKEKPEGIGQLHDEYLLKKECFIHPSFFELNKLAITHEDLIHQINRYYLVLKLHLVLCSYTTNNFVTIDDESVKRELYFIQEIIDIYGRADFQSMPQIKLLKELLEAFMTKNFENYVQIKLQFISNIHLYDDYEKSDLFHILTIACYEMHKQGKPKAINELFELNQYAIENKVFFENGYIRDITFRNIVNIAGAARELNWAEYFIKNFAVFLEEKKREDNITLCEIVVDFYKKEYGIVLNKLAQLKFNDVFMNVHARSIQLQCYYELDDSFSDLFSASAKTFGGFLKNNEIIGDGMKESIRNFIHFTVKLKKFKKMFRPDIQPILEKITNSKVVHRIWLIEKVREFLR